MALSIEDENKKIQELAEILRKNNENKFHIKEGEGIDHPVIIFDLPPKFTELPKGWKFDKEAGTFVWSDEVDIYRVQIQRQPLVDIKTQQDIVYELKRTNPDINIVKVGNDFKIDKDLETINWESLRHEGFVWDESVGGLINPNVLNGGQPLCIKLTYRSYDKALEKDGIDVSSGAVNEYQDGSALGGFTDTTRNDYSGGLNAARQGDSNIAGEQSDLRDNMFDVTSVRETNQLNSMRDLREVVMKYYLQVNDNGQIVATERSSARPIEDKAIIEKLRVAESLIKTHYASKGRVYNGSTLDEAILKEVFDNRESGMRQFAAIVTSIEDLLASGSPLSIEGISNRAAMKLGGDRVLVKNSIMALLSTQELGLKQIEKDSVPKDQKRNAIIDLVSNALGLNPIEAKAYLQQYQNMNNSLNMEEENVMERKISQNNETDRE